VRNFGFIESTLLGVACLALGCGTDAEQQFAGMKQLSVQTADGLGYRLRYLDPPWKQVSNDPLLNAKSRGTVQFGAHDGEGDTAQPDLLPEPESARVLEIERATDGVNPAPDLIVTYPKYRLEAALLRCEALGIPVATDETCAARLNRLDEAGREATERSGFFGAGGREGVNAAGQRYHEFMTLVKDTGRYRRVVYFETPDRLVAARLGFEANPALSEREITQMVDAFEVLEGTASGNDAGAEGSP
jgi:hypothetical protein